MKDLLEAGVHFGHQTKRWNPKMKEYIFGERNGIYIIDLNKTVKLFREAEEFVTNLAAEGRTILFVGTKRQARLQVETQARRVGMPFVTERWLGGTLTNFRTIRSRLARLEELEKAEADGTALKASVFYPSGRGLLDTGMWTSDRNRPPELARERPRTTPAMTMDALREMAAGAGKELPIQPLDELAELVVDGIRDERFIMILPMPTTEESLRARLDKELALENPTVVKPLGL